MPEFGLNRYRQVLEKVEGGCDNKISVGNKKESERKKTKPPAGGF
ncbi:hypothetical protein QLZ26_10070 [Cronobacter universalis]|nr:hypothetical protein [Cronobacter universalis]MDI7660448.1 hypothetical protein [Cronobacter universalis]